MNCKCKWIEKRCGISDDCDMLCGIHLRDVQHIIDCEIVGYEGFLSDSGTIYCHTLKLNRNKKIELMEDYYGREDRDEHCLAGFTEIEYLIIDGEVIVGDMEVKEKRNTITGKEGDIPCSTQQKS